MERCFAVHLHIAKSSLHIAVALLVTSCVSSVSALPIVPNTIAAWSLNDVLPELRAASCPADPLAKSPTPIELTYDEVDGTLITEILPEHVSLTGAWHVTSDNSNWGGISGVDYSKAGTLIAVSDRGALFELPLTDAQPDPEASVTYLLGNDGNPLSGKKRGDSEGIALYDGAALISFERDHRIDVYDIETCGAAARPANLAALPDMRDGYAIDPNRGPEALAVSANGTVSFVYEQPGAQSASIGVIGENSEPEILTARIATPFAYAMVGRDHATLSDGSEITADLLRSYDPLRGIRARLRVGDTEITLIPPMPVDNFEGVALQPQDNGSVIAWIISDNNFKADQRTLLFAFTIAQK